MRVDNMLPVSIDKWPAGLREEHAERAAIMEYDGGLFRWCAEFRAERRIREREAV